MSEPDELFTVRTLFWLGSYQAAINEATSNKRIPATLVGEKEEYIYRCFLALGQYSVITSEIKEKPNTSVGLRAIKLLAAYFESPDRNREIALQQLNEWLSDPIASVNKTVMMIAATFFIHEDNIKEAFKIIKNGSNLEQHALLVQLHLRICRLDLAQKQVKIMKALDEDSTLSMLATAWVDVSLGGAKVQEAQYVYEELIDKYGGSSSLLNGLAATKMHLGNFEEAESNLQEALMKAPGDPDSLANLVVVSHHLQRSSDVVNRYLSQLQAKAPYHSLVTAVAAQESAFDRVAVTLA